MLSRDAVSAARRFSHSTFQSHLGQLLSHRLPSFSGEISSVSLTASATPSVYHIGLDISSKCTGYTIMNSIGRPLQCGTIETQHVSHDLYQYGQHMHFFFKDLMKEWDQERCKFLFERDSSDDNRKEEETKSELNKTKTSSTSKNKKKKVNSTTTTMTTTDAASALGSESIVTDTVPLTLNQSPKFVIGVEDYAIKFSIAKSSAHSLFKLSQCNMLCCYEAQNVLKNVQIIRANATSARSLFQISKNSTSSINTARHIQPTLNTLLDQAEEEEEFLNDKILAPRTYSSSSKSDIKQKVFDAVHYALPKSYAIQYYKRKGEILLSPRNFDVTDSLLMAFYSFVRHHALNIVSNVDNSLLFVDALLTDPNCKSKKLKEFARAEKLRLRLSGVAEDDLNLVTAQACLDNEVIKRELDSLFLAYLQDEALQYLKSNILTRPQANDLSSNKPESAIIHPLI